MQLSKRKFIKLGLFSGLGIVLACKSSFAKSKGAIASINNKNRKKMAIELPNLPYERNALAPHISEETLNFHYGKHHNAYVVNLNKLIEGTEFAGKSLEEIVKSSSGGVFNNAAQVWNHTFYWNSMKPNGGGKPGGEFLAKIEEDFGSYEEFAKEFKAAGATQFGSGWAWLVLDGGKLKVTKTPNAETPLTTNATPLLTMDVWEHAYYLDYQNARPGYMDVFLDKLVNWEFAEANFKAAA